MDVSILLGKTLAQIDNSEDEIRFHCTDDTVYLMYHSQQCCESVTVDSIDGNLPDLIGYPLTMAEEVSNYDEGAKGSYDESYTWTFYKFATVRGYVTIKWYGVSNGYYSESVDFKQIV